MHSHDLHPQEHVPPSALPDLSEHATDLTSGDEIPQGSMLGGRYLVGPVFASGGMGVVCTGRHVDLGQEVAIKFLRREIFGRPSITERFLNEARAAASLRSENVVRVFDVGELESGLPYLVMERLEGVDLDKVVESEGPLDVGRAIDYVLQACAALAEAHERGIIHRDIKPENLFLARGAGGREIVKVLDFGLAKRIEESKNLGLTGPNDSMGSPYYMSPEQVAQPQSVDARSHIWSLGVVLYRLITSRVPFDGDTVMEVYARILNAPPRSMRDLRPDLGLDLDAIVLRCLDKDPNRRFQTAGDLADALREHRDGYRRLHETPSSMTPPVFVDDTPIEIPGVHSRWPALLAFAAVALGGALLYEADRSGRMDVRELGTTAAARIEETSAFRAIRDESVDVANTATRYVNRARGVPELEPTADMPVRAAEPAYVVPARGVVTESPAFDSSGRTLAAIPELDKSDAEDASNEHPVFILDSKPVAPVLVPPNALPYGDASALDDQ